jgi:Tol biopolymer transport system component
VLLVLAAIGVTLYLTVLKDGDAGESNGGSSSSTTLSPPEAALEALPRSAEPLATNLLVLPRTVDENTDLHLVDSATGETVQRLTTGPEADVGAVISPDRRSIAFARSTDGVVELRVIGADGTGDSPLFATPPADCDRPSRPAWNPEDPTEVALVCAGADAQPDALRLFTLDGATVRTLETGHSVLGDLAVSADGTRVGYWAGDDPQVDGGDLYTLAVDGSEAPQQLTDVQGGADADMVWSHDGTKIAFRREVAQGERQIFVMNADGGDVRSITSGSFDQDPIFSPDDTQIAFKSDRTGPDGGDDHIWIIGVDGSDKHQLAAPYGPDHQPPTWGRR